MKQFLLICLLLTLFVGCASQYMHAIPIVVHLENKTGLAVDSDRLYFGTINPQATIRSTRTVNVTNNENYPSIFHFTITGDMKGWATVSPRLVTLQPRESVTVSVTLHPDANESYGKYEGLLEARYR